MGTGFKFHVGYYDDLHPVPAVNIQMNRWINYLGESALEEFRAISPRLTDFPYYRREFLTLAEKALAEGRKMHDAYNFRSAEIFMWRYDPEKQPTRQKFLQLLFEYYDNKESDCHSIPYQDGEAQGNLFACRFNPKNAKDTIVLFGGFDSYIEVFFPILLELRDRGYDVICFEGPGQGRVLDNSGLFMTPDWHKPVKSVLDYNKVGNIVL